MKLPIIPNELITQLDQVIQRFQTKLLTRSCVPLSTGVGPISTKAMKITDELLDMKKIRDELWPEKKKFLASHNILSYCLVWSYWGLKTKKPELHKAAMTVYGCSIYVRFFRKFFQFCDDSKFQMALQRASIRSHYSTKTHMAIISHIVDNQVAKPTTSTNNVFNRYDIITNTLRQSMRGIAHAYYEEPTNINEPKLDIANILRITEGIWDFPNEEASNAIISRYNLNKVTFLCLQGFVRKNKNTLLRFFESALYKSPPTNTLMKSKSWFKKVTTKIFKNPDFKTYISLSQRTCTLSRPNIYWNAFFEYTHERLKLEVVK
jgi:hypothetical protein